MTQKPEPDGSGLVDDPAADGSAGRLLDVLDLFSDRVAVLSVREVCQRLGYTKSTAYRYIRALCNAGLLASMEESAYTLGPRIVELDRLVRLTDPVLQAGERVMATVASEIPNSIVLLCTLYRDKVLCIHREGPETLETSSGVITIARARGVALPLFQGAASVAILAFLPPYRIRALYLAHQQSIQQAGLGATWTDFRASLAGIRRQGHMTTTGRYHHALAAVSVPVQVPGGSKVVGSLTRILPRELYEQHPNLPVALAAAASLISSGDIVEGGVKNRGQPACWSQVDQPG